MSSNTESYSREELVNDHILTRLPVKSLLRYKRVCKSWRDLITSSSFIKKHLDNESTGTRKIVAKFGVDYDTEPLPTRQFHIYLLPDKIFAGTVPTHQRTFYIDGVSDFRDIHGPMNGIFLLEKGHFMDNIRFAWWNPATKQIRLIPKFEFELKETFNDCCRMLGMGYDKTTQDYKIISFRTFWDEWTTNLHPKIFAALYSTKHDSWKYLEPNYSHECQISVTQNFTYKDGLYHWMASSQVICDQDNVFRVLTFDFATELFGEMPGPPIPGNSWTTLMLRGGSLATMASNEVAKPMIATYDIWQRIRENNWIKVYTLNPPIPWHWPNGMWEYDKYIFELTETYRLVFYDQSAKQATNLGFDFFQRLQSGWAWPLNYKESLFPIPLRSENPTEQDNIEYFFGKF
ncbi:F-box/kelch-repeat protein At3g23880-like [Lycium ferocissimum]|uniref:F-box/kelch-repeat protein At3g23880-like n=1 Tax=Lycium ferocissimum TaxID=112874 RepID=UPI002814A5FB|nr:F-box/kelch-repeat protein At3g23880-like [Lycium ferocissimum]